MGDAQLIALLLCDLQGQRYHLLQKLSPFKVFTVTGPGAAGPALLVMPPLWWVLCLHPDIWSPQASDQLSGPCDVKHLACLDLQPPHGSHLSLSPSTPVLLH